MPLAACTMLSVRGIERKEIFFNSLHQFAVRKKSPLCVRFDLNLPEIRPITHSVRMDADTVPASFTLLSLRLYLVEALPGILAEFRSGSQGPHSALNGPA
jgi:hypothetical protein